MNAETKTKLEEFYKQRIKFNIRSIDITKLTQILTFTILRLTYFLKLILHLQEINF